MKTAICLIPNRMPGLLVLLAGAGSLHANLLVNPGFESGLLAETWNPQWVPVEAGALVTTTAARGAGYGAWVYTAGGSALESYAYLSQTVAASAGQKFSGSVFARTPPPGQWIDWVAGSYACVRIVFRNAGGAVLAMAESPHLTTASTPYGAALEVTTALAPGGTAYVEFGCLLYEPAGDPRQSVVNFDDATFEAVIPPPPVPAVYPAALGFGTDLTSTTLQIRNTGSDTLTWSIASDKPWLTPVPASGTTTTETDTVTVNLQRSGLTTPYESAVLTVTTNGGNLELPALAETLRATVPALPSEVSVAGSRLMVRRRLPNGTLDLARPHVIKGAAWSPADSGCTSDPDQRRNQFATWYRTDVRLLKDMHANTAYVFLDPGTAGTQLQASLRVLDALYLNGIMVVMTVDQDGSDTTANILPVVNAYRNHPAILMWALGNEWNLWRPDRPKYYYHHDTLAQAAAAMQANALTVKSLDSNHPVCSILGEINQPDAASVTAIVRTTCAAVDVWGANIYRGAGFYGLFDEWAAITTKPLYLSEFGTDAFRTSSWWPPVGAEDQAMQANRLTALWRDLTPHLSAVDPSQACLGGTVFEFNDEWWKTGTGSASVHDSGGYETTWNADAHPDGFANEEWFGIVGADRGRRQAYFSMQAQFAPPPTPFAVRPAVQGGTLYLSFPAELGQRYALEESGDLATWSAAPFAPLDATATELSFACPLPAAKSRFFRVSRVP
ncbi:MAG: hypothetical protein NTW21_44880 [Verrucomicrobia bacterium]|nr:hypothetical protein [Verrucomicrobiota bacterium]